MTAPLATAAARSPATAPPPDDDRHGYGTTALGALVGVLVVAGAGIAIGLGLAELYYDPEAGLANLGLMLFPIGLGAIGTLVGAFLGVRTALRRVGDELASRTAWMTVPVTVLGLGLLAAWGTGLVVLVAMPFLARWLALRAV